MFLGDGRGDTLPLEKIEGEIGGGFVKAVVDEESQFKFLSAEIGHRSALISIYKKRTAFMNCSKQSYIFIQLRYWKQLVSQAEPPEIRVAHSG